MSKRLSKQTPDSTIAVREVWLNRSVESISKAWKSFGVTVPVDVRVSCSWPGGGSARKRLGECWPRERSKGGVNEIFISPSMADGARVLDVLGHELLHAADNCKSGHGRPFTALSKLVGYSGGKHSAVVDSKAQELVSGILKELGDYPHQELTLREKRTNQRNNLQRFVCSEDGDNGDVLYSSAGKCGAFGVPVCRCHGKMMVAVAGKAKKYNEHL